ncbi:TPA: hypothetical protein QCY65_003031 [Bacillus cereus]|nr:hypothetical protein [Bacillus cereus]HDR8416993.1 hypothetical protein [Bacillus cereus]
MSFLNWINDNQGFIMAGLTLIYVLATIRILRANAASVEEMKKTREEENRPYVVAYLEFKTNGAVHFILKNIGKTMALDTKVEVSPRVEMPKSMPLSDSNLLTQPIPNIPPQFEYKAFIGMGWDIKDKETDKYPIFKAKVEYKNSNDKSIVYVEEYIMDLNFESGLLYMREYEVHDLVKSFDKFSKGNQKALNNINKNLANLEEGAKTKFPKGDAKQIPMEDMI